MTSLRKPLTYSSASTTCERNSNVAREFTYSLTYLPLSKHEHARQRRGEGKWEPPCDVHWHFFKRPLPHGSGVAQSICLPHSVERRSQNLILFNHRCGFIRLFVFCSLQIYATIFTCLNSFSVSMIHFFAFPFFCPLFHFHESKKKKWQAFVQVNILAAVWGEMRVLGRKTELICGPVKDREKVGEIKGKQQ